MKQVNLKKLATLMRENGIVSYVGQWFEDHVEIQMDPDFEMKKKQLETLNELDEVKGSFHNHTRERTLDEKLEEFQRELF